MQGRRKVVKSEEARRSEPQGSKNRGGGEVLGDRGHLSHQLEGLASGGVVYDNPAASGAMPWPKSIFVFLIQQKASSTTILATTRV